MTRRRGLPRGDLDARIARSWDENAAAWTAAIGGGAFESRRLVTDRAVLDAALELGVRLLDVGCGEGWLAHRLARQERTVTGFDGSAPLIERARERCDSATFIHLDYDGFIREPTLVGAGFDAALCNFSLLTEHVRPLLTALRVVVRPAGRLLVQTLHPFTACADGLYADGWREERFDGLPGQWQPMPWYFRTIGGWIRELDGSGWRVIECREPLHPETGRPASLLFLAARVDGSGTPDRAHRVANPAEKPET